MTIHNKQFIICKKKVPYDNFSALSLCDGLTLSIHKNIPVHQISASGKNIILIGWAFQTIPNAKSPYEDLASINETNVAKISDDWSGRWVLLIDNKLYMDAVGTLAVFYTQLNNQEVCISSSLSLMREMFQIEAEDFSYKDYRWDWFPGPKTVLKNVNILFASQRLTFSNDGFTIEYHNHIDQAKYAAFSDQLLIQEIAKRMTTLMRNISASNKELTLRLSGGNDCRVLLAALLASKVDFKAVTFKLPNMSKCDFRIPRKLARDFGFPYKLIHPGTFLEEKQNELFKHSLNYIDKNDSYYLCTGILDNLGEGIILHGGIWEVARIYFKALSRVKNEDSDAIKTNALELVFPKISTSSAASESLQLWLNYTKEHPMKIDWENRFTLDQNMGCWLSYNRQAMDYFPFFLYSIINSGTILSMLYSISPEFRRHGKHQEEIIRIIEPRLAKYSYNTVYLDEKIVMLFKKIVKKLKRFFFVLKRKVVVYSKAYFERIKLALTPR